MNAGYGVPDRLAAVRRLLLALLALGFAATTVDLLLLAHYEDTPQLIPLALNGLVLVTIVWHAVAAGELNTRVLQVLMVACVAAGFVGVVLHYRGNLEFQLEIDPSQSAWTLFSKVMRAKAPPAMAPGIMVQLGLLGLIYAYRHPALDAPWSSTTLDPGADS